MQISTMTLEQQVLGLPSPERLKLMETIWSSLSSDSDYPSPDWHRSVLAETTERYAAGKEESTDWQAAKKQLRSE
jgi:hypothetical protein